MLLLSGKCLGRLPEKIWCGMRSVLVVFLAHTMMSKIRCAILYPIVDSYQVFRVGSFWKDAKSNFKLYLVVPRHKKNTYHAPVRPQETVSRYGIVIPLF